MTIARQEEMIRQLQAAKDALDRKERELGDLQRRLQEEREMSAQERDKLEREIAEHSAQITVIRSEVSCARAAAFQIGCAGVEQECSSGRVAS